MDPTIRPTAVNATMTPSALLDTLGQLVDELREITPTARISVESVIDEVEQATQQLHGLLPNGLPVDQRVCFSVQKSLRSIIDVLDQWMNDPTTTSALVRRALTVGDSLLHIHGELVSRALDHVG